jgi:hypothetical protein
MSLLQPLPQPVIALYQVRNDSARGILPMPAWRVLLGRRGGALWVSRKVTYNL